MSPDNTNVSMSDTNADISKSSELQLHHRCTALSHIANRRKDARDIYFSMLRYDITMYDKQCEVVEQATDRNSAMMQMRTGPVTYGEVKRKTPLYSKCRKIWTTY